MVAATHNIIAGRFDQEVRSNSPGEIGLLAESFNAMLKSLRQMKGDLEEWGRTLEEKVKQRTEELVAMQARMAQSERLASLGMLAAGVAHEVNNPLGGILALTCLTVEDMRDNDPNRENLEEVIRQTERCRDIVKGLLEFSRQSKSNTESIDLNRVLEDTLSLVAKQALFFNIAVDRRLDPELPAVMADRAQFQQVFMNILMNAVQAMDERGVITLVSRRNAAGKCVEVSLSDTGHGIPPEQINRIFDPFFTTKASGRGTGLGLSIAYGIVTTHGGTISVRSELGKGSVFTIRMPVAPA
jgi:two-component system NtrC family sensor kinase